MQNFEPVEGGNIGAGQYMRVVKATTVDFRVACRRATAETT
jgi:hypothetical protein